MTAGARGSARWPAPSRSRRSSRRGLLVAFAADVLRWDRTMRDGRHRVRRARGAPSWEPNTLLPRGLSRAALGLADDVEYRGAVDQFWKSDPRAPLRVFTDVTRRTAAERRIARLMDDERAPSRRSVLATLRGALLLEEARNSPVQRHVFLRRAIEQFQRASELDPAQRRRRVRPRAGAQAAARDGRGNCGSR